MHILDLSSSVSKGETICDSQFISAWLATVFNTIFLLLYLYAYKRLKNWRGGESSQLAVESFGERDAVLKNTEVNKIETKELWE